MKIHIDMYKSPNETPPHIYSLVCVYIDTIPKKIYFI